MKTEDIRKLGIATAKGYFFIEPREIIRCESDGNYTTLYLTGNQKHCVCRQLGLLEEDLPPDLFMRVHHSHVVNLLFLDRYERIGLLWLHDGDAIPVARRRRRELLTRLKSALWRIF